ncbi:MAG: cryptochrome/photolyase family protein [Nocardioidaceae bacterium]
MSTSVMWFRRDLRLADHPALVAAAEAADDVVPLFVLDPTLWDRAGVPRRAYLVASLASLSERVGGLVVRTGDPVEVVAALAAEVGAGSVFVSADFNPYGGERDRRVEAALAEAGALLVRSGSPYAVDPGQVRNQQDAGYQVFTPFSRAWREHGWDRPVPAPAGLRWRLDVPTEDLPVVERPDGMALPAAGEPAALARWRGWAAAHLGDYATGRDRPALDITSRMSVHLKWGEIHPRTMLADVQARCGDVQSRQRYSGELAWREFYADVLARRPESAREYFRPELARMRYEEPGPRFEAWKEGRTGYPIVDAGMRQLRSEGWMHNRVRMIVASFLVKDLHIEWQHGARHFMHWLVDADLASNQHNWQWTAGSGTDPAPYFRVFNPIDQGKKFDPDGHYIRRHVPELRDLPTDELHRPHDPIVDHQTERREALARYEAVRNE